MVVHVLGGIHIYMNVFAVYLLNRVMAMVVNSDLKFLSNIDALWTSGGRMHLDAEASSLLPGRVSVLE